MVASSAGAHTEGTPISPHDFWTAWSLQPSVVVPIAIAALLYGRGLRLAWSRAGFGRGTAAWRAGLFALGLTTLWAGLVWPLDAIGESLFSAHMAQRIVLMGMAAPLLVLGLPMPTMIRSLPREWQRGLALAVRWQPWRRFWEFVTRIDVATILQLLVFTLWHIPAAIALSLENDFVHWLMHGSMLAAGLLFWTAILRMRSDEFGSAILALFVNFKFSLVLGALLAFSSRAFYESYLDRGLPWGVTLLEDQQLAGVLMMVVQSMMYLLALVIRVAVLLRSPERRVATSLMPQCEGLPR
ncbi:cytochrome c oxidase assembly protein [Hoeflea sp. BAL378]|uniref:cytochrome c oxidase assembly protein n=1 Tax=Hoeflea sp. BAL378 TaxID=1547437 RepID=UPI00068F168D|nr:cytochrome c oxidase assembly protein [Hoeflea sp. BAL378]